MFNKKQTQQKDGKDIVIEKLTAQIKTMEEERLNSFPRVNDIVIRTGWSDGYNTSYTYSVKVDVDASDLPLLIKYLTDKKTCSDKYHKLRRELEEEKKTVSDGERKEE